MSAIAEQPAASPTVRVELLFALRDVAGTVAGIQLAAAENDAAATAAIAVTLRGSLEQTIEMFAELQRADEEDAGEPLDDLDAVEPDAWVAPRSLRRQPLVGNVCFAGGLELRRVLRELTVADSTDELQVAAETARRKLRRSIRAVLEAARETGVHDVLGGEHQGRHQVADLASALAVRKLYARFRRALRRADDASPEAVLAAVRYAGGALATLVAAPDYADVRASDRAVLRRLRERALRWARGDRAVRTGLQLLEDVRTCGDLLRDINRRQELKLHDAAQIARLSRGPDDNIAAWFTELDALVGLDDALDDLIERARALRVNGAGLEALVPETLIRLGQVH